MASTELDKLRVAAGPGKKRKKGQPGLRYTPHKRRSAWFQCRAAWPFREAEGDRVPVERARVPRSVPPEPWTCVGPTNIGGRATSLAVHPTNPEKLWLGAAGGGVWYSDDGGKTWTSQWHSEHSLNVGSLAIDPRSPSVLYCGTGEANLSADSYAGVGIYKTADGGASWSLWADAKVVGLPRRIGVIAVDPFDSNHILIGGVTHADDEPSGMYLTEDGGVTWRRESFPTTFGYYCHAIVFHPTQPGTIFTTVVARGGTNGVWRSRDGGPSWEQLKTGLPSPEKFRRASLAIAPSKPDTIYLLASAAGEGVLGVFRSQDGGSSWASIGGDHFDGEGQMSYGNTIVVHPLDADHVLCGGVDLHRTVDGGATWRRVTRWDAARGSKGYAHADHHALVMPASAPGLVYDANDGGLDRSDDGGRNWTNRSDGLATIMYYDLDVAPSDARAFGGGTQDNGTNVTFSGHDNDHNEILGGDGGWMVYHPEKANWIFASYYNFHVFRFRGAQVVDVSPDTDEAERESIWMCFITLDPNKPNRVFTGTDRVWRSTDAGDLWEAVSQTLDGSSISAIEVAPGDSKLVLVGTENGGLFRSTDGGKTWSDSFAGPQMSGRTITRIDAHPSDPRIIYATTAGVLRSHVYRSSDGGLTWADVDRGALPDVPHHAVVIQPDNPNTIYVCNDVGVFVSFDDGLNWMNLSGMLPNVMVVDLVYHVADRALYAATYGRSTWKLDVA